MLYEGYKKWAGSDQTKLERFPGPVYYMLHSFSHLLLTAISLECGYPASSLRETKRLLKAGVREATARAIAEESVSFGRLLQSAEAREAFSAFLERRAPDFSRTS